MVPICEFTKKTGSALATKGCADDTIPNPAGTMHCTMLSDDHVVVAHDCGSPP